ncbi:MAG: hypothetical protein V4628_17290 [Pseudomonadota bacterium]
MEINERELLVTNTLVENFYKVLPLELRTYCPVTSLICKNVLLHFGIKADLLPCQVWLVTPDHNFVVGFTGNTSTPQKWDGHVVCATENLIIDAALHHFSKEFDLNVPLAAAVLRFQMSTQVIARHDLNEKNGLWWHCPPSAPEIDVTVPEQPTDVIAKYSAQMIEHLSGMPAIVLGNGTFNHARSDANNPWQKQ